MLSPRHLMVWVDVVALQLADGKNTAELNVLGAVLNQVGDALQTMAAQQTAIENIEKARATRVQQKKAAAQEEAS